MEYTKDEYKKDILVDDTGFQVMMEWEKPYMEFLVDHLAPTGDVLEIGFGLGYSATAIQKHNIKSHTIIEANPIVIDKIREWAKDKPHPVHIVEGTWQTTLSSLKTFDSIFFDDSPHKDHPDKEDLRGYAFYYKILRNHVNPGCRYTWYCDIPIYWIAHPGTEWKCSTVSTAIPKNCRYVPFSSATQNTVYAPLVTFPYGTIPNAEPVALNSFLQFKKLTS